MLRIQDVKAYYDTPKGIVKAVDGVSFEVQDNEILSIAGESGCGKSTLLRVLYDLISRPLHLVAGTMEAEITDHQSQTKILRSGEISQVWGTVFSYIPQGSMNVLNPVVRIEHEFFNTVKKVHNVKDKQAIRTMVTKYLNELGLPVEVLRSYPHQLSGGMRQRVVVALATFLHPQIILADEPTTALDVVVQKSILNMLVQVQQRMQSTLVIVSHDMGVHYEIGHRILIMYAGKILELGDIEVVFNTPLHPYSTMLINSLPRVGDRKQKQGIGGAPPNLLNPPIGCPFAPRCPHVMEICQQQEPSFVAIKPGHYVACHLHVSEEYNHGEQ